MKIPSDLKRKLKKFSEEDLDQFIVKRGFEGCLECFPMPSWQKQRALVESKLNLFNPKHRKFIRKFLDGVKEVAIDSADRLLIPGKLLAEAAISTEMVILVQFDRMELWDAERLKKARAVEDDSEYSDLAAEVMGGKDDHDG